MRKLLTLCLTLSFGISLWAYHFKSGDLYYNITSSVEPYTVEVTYELIETAYTKDNYEGVVNVVIPEYIIHNSKKYLVTAIGENAFFESSSIRSISIPNSIKSLGYASLLCTNLTRVTIPESITSIPYNSSATFKSEGCCIYADTIVFLNPSGVSVGQYLSSSGYYFGIAGNPVCYIPCGSREAYEKNLFFRNGLPKKIEEFLPYLLVVNVPNSQTGIIKTSQIDCTSYIITAVPKDGYTFVKWSDGNTQAIRYIELTQDTTLTAYFAKEGYTIHVYQDCNTTIE